MESQNNMKNVKTIFSPLTTAASEKDICTTFLMLEVHKMGRRNSKTTKRRRRKRTNSIRQWVNVAS